MSRALGLSDQDVNEVELKSMPPGWSSLSSGEDEIRTNTGGGEDDRELELPPSVSFSLAIGMMGGIGGGRSSSDADASPDFSA